MQWIGLYRQPADGDTGIRGSASRGDRPDDISRLLIIGNFLRAENRSGLRRAITRVVAMG